MEYKSKILTYYAAGLILISAAGVGLKRVYDGFHEPKPEVEITVPLINGVPADFDGDGISDIRAIFVYSGGPIKPKVKDSAGNIMEFSEDGKIVE